MTMQISSLNQIDFLYRIRIYLPVLQILPDYGNIQIQV